MSRCCNTNQTALKGPDPVPAHGAAESRPASATSPQPLAEEEESYGFGGSAAEKSWRKTKANKSSQQAPTTSFHRERALQAANHDLREKVIDDPTRLIVSNIIGCFLRPLRAAAG